MPASGPGYSLKMKRSASIALIALALGACKGPSSSGDNEGGVGAGGDQAGGSGPGGDGGSPEGGDGGSTNEGGSVASGGAASGGDGGTASGGTSSGGAGGTASGGTASAGGAGVPAGTRCAQDPRCDDLEAYAVNSKPGGPFSNSRGSLAVDGTRAYSGTKSIKTTVGGESRIDHGGYGLFPANKIFMRAMIYLDQVPQVSGLYWTFMHAQGGTEGGLNNIFFDIGSHSGGRRLTLYRGEASGGIQDCAATGQGSLVAGKWQCVEMEIDAATDAARIYFDGKLDEGLEVFAGGTPLGPCEPGQDFTNSVWYLPPITKIGFGPRTFRANTTATMWIDDIAVSDARIGCPPPP